MLCATLDGREVWRRMDTCVCKAESLRYSLETTTTLSIGYIPIENKKFKGKKRGANKIQKDVSNLINVYASEPRKHSVQFSHSVVSNSLQPHGLQHARLPCRSPTLS